MYTKYVFHNNVAIDDIQVSGRGGEGVELRAEESLRRV